MFRQQNRSCSVFVGNVPYDVDEEQLKSIFSTVGPVVSFRLMHDKVTGRPKGYGFCEYADQETAYAAMRNLNNVECGGRPLRVDWADHELRNTEGVQRSIQRSGADVGRSNVKVNNKKLREFQQRLTDENAEHLALDVQTHSEIAALLNQWSTVELYQFLGQSQQFVSESPEAARSLFVAHPQLPLAINHVAYLLGFTSEPTFPMTPDDMIYAEERIKALKQHRVCPVKPIQPPRAVPISLVTDPTAQLQAGISNPMMMSGVLPAGVLAAGASIAGARATTVGTISRVTSIGTSGLAPHHAMKKPAVDIAALPADTKEALRKQLAQMTPAEVASLPADVREIMQQLAVSTGGSAVGSGSVPR